MVFVFNINSPVLKCLGTILLLSYNCKTNHSQRPHVQIRIIIVLHLQFNDAASRRCWTRFPHKLTCASDRRGDAAPATKQITAPPSNLRVLQPPDRPTTGVRSRTAMLPVTFDGSATGPATCCWMRHRPKSSGLRGKSRVHPDIAVTVRPSCRVERP